MPWSKVIIHGELARRWVNDFMTLISYLYLYIKIWETYNFSYIEQIISQYQILNYS